tara:strand:- start:656 stop:1033 length:378 start_codon:yes stop_codon:yes gene_type:complete
MKFKGKHSHRCKNCDKVFFGRLNTLYCSKECKWSFNNEKAREKNKQLKEECDLLRDARNALEKLYNKYGNQRFAFNELTTLGFDVKLSGRSISMEYKPGNWRKVCQYAILFSKEDQMAEIINLDD